MQSFQGIIFIWNWTYMEIFKSELEYLWSRSIIHIFCHTPFLKMMVSKEKNCPFCTYFILLTNFEKNISHICEDFQEKLEYFSYWWGACLRVKLDRNSSKNWSIYSSVQHLRNSSGHVLTNNVVEII